MFVMQRHVHDEILRQRSSLAEVQEVEGFLNGGLAGVLHFADY
jgi:hypothetical protein